MSARERILEYLKIESRNRLVPQVYYELKMHGDEIILMPQDGEKEVIVRDKELLYLLNGFNFDRWRRRYERKDVCVMDGMEWSIRYRYRDCEEKKITGHAMFPNSWYRLLKVIYQLDLKAIDA